MLASNNNNNFILFPSQTLNLYHQEDQTVENGLNMDIIKMSPENKAYHKLHHLTVHVDKAEKLKQAPLISTAEKVIKKYKFS